MVKVVSSSATANDDGSTAKTVLLRIKVIKAMPDQYVYDEAAGKERKLVKGESYTLKLQFTVKAKGKGKPGNK